jgi:hypothetical protein
MRPAAVFVIAADDIVIERHRSTTEVVRVGLVCVAQRVPQRDPQKFKIAPKRAPTWRIDAI